MTEENRNQENTAAGEELRDYRAEYEKERVKSAYLADRVSQLEDEVDDLLIQTDRQLLTLVTCIRGEDGFDRFLVICEKQ